MKTGIDILEIERVKTDDDFLLKIFTHDEIEYINKFANKMERIAGFFCAKEAIFKALDLEKINHKEIEISHEKTGRPIVNFYGKTLQHFNKYYSKIEVSISHSKTVATAIAIVEEKSRIERL